MSATNRRRYVLAVVEGATENIQALLDNLLARGLDPTLPRLFIVDGAIEILEECVRKTIAGGVTPESEWHSR